MTYDPVCQDPPSLDPAHPATMAELCFDCCGCRVNGVLYVAQGAGPHPTVVLLHGFPGNERNFDLAQVLRRAGWNVLVFHYRGNWGSEGDYSLAHVLEDAGSALAFLRSEEACDAYRVDRERLVLIGHSLGGFAALMIAADDSDVRAAASVAGINIAVWAKGVGEARRANALQMFEGALSRLHGTSAEALLDEMLLQGDTWDLRGLAPALVDRPVLLVAATRDEGLPLTDHHEPLVEAMEKAGARHLTAVVLESDHGFNDRRIALSRTILDWLDSLPGAPAGRAGEPGPG